jgi:hypothetical protein
MHTEFQKTISKHHRQQRGRHPKKTSPSLSNPIHYNF